MLYSKFKILFILFSVLSLTNENSAGSPNVIKYFATLTASEIAKIPKSVIEDSSSDTTKLVEKYGYPIESHEIETEDGYILTAHRIPRGKNDDTEKVRVPIFLMHGILCSSSIWVFNGPESLAFKLADADFDVWMPNARGNYYSRKHLTLNPDHTKFWKFSWHEIGYYDHPATIDYILNVTGHEKLHFIGYSQGATSFFVMASERLEYNEKIIAMHALGPVVYMNNARSPLVKYLSPFSLTFDVIIALIGMNEFLPSSELNTVAAHMFCGKDSIFLPVCTNILFLIAGYSPNQLNTTLLPVYMSHTPAGSSSRQLGHFGQLYNSGKFRKYDYGSRLINLYTYGLSNPPEYDLKLVSAPVYLHYGENDWMVGEEDIDRLHKELGNSVGKFKVPLSEFNHLDFMWATDAPGLLYDLMIKLMKGD